MMKRGGTTTESAEASYRIRVAIKSLKEQMSKMQEICDKEGRKVLETYIEKAKESRKGR
jgi:hypothetical protein